MNDNLPNLIETVLRRSDEAAQGFERHPVTRRGPRPQFSPIYRTMILARDGFRCLLCGWDGALELDHIVPWSAGGSDEATNLRSLCVNCNQARSNYRDYAPTRPALPVTHYCRWCYGPDTVNEAGDLVHDFDGPDDVHAWCWTCGMTSRSEPWLLVKPRYANQDDDKALRRFLRESNPYANVIGGNW